MSERFVPSLVVNHAPWAIDRLHTLREMLEVLTPMPNGGTYWTHDTDYRGGGPTPKIGPVDFTLAQWRWAAAQKEATHHVFMTDDLELAYGFWDILEAMVSAIGLEVIGLLSNHPAARNLQGQGARWYKTNSWVVGPCYVIPHRFLEGLLTWSEARGPAGSVDGLGWADDSELNEWITRAGPAEAFHPIPTPIRHLPFASTWTHTGHGDQYSRECVSWRQYPWYQEFQAADSPSALMSTPLFWDGADKAPLLSLP